ncbi:GntR family transcriptional regulator [Frondihabitans australicus]|uniref:GntR family transcriptional regulator n=1 Tax=Frondihabitans australicus TaxID=386892 RepID=A0A495ILE4_9MICO|nr:GntR family transcriptional regulator [Frondihabitans australicus]RKR76540.1 GntR family transcriptional regulator [Frondihabitans australicus]
MADPRPARIPRRQSLADGVYDELMARLFDNTLDPGASLNIDALSRELDVSQTPIREALARLEATGLVVREALRGYRVAPILSPKELGDLLDARAALEPVNARLAASHVDAAFLDALGASIEQLASSPTGPSFADYHAYWEADERFHDLIARQADNVFLYRAFESLGGQAQRFRLFGGLGVSDAESAISEHRAILSALRAGDAAAAERAMTTHVTNVKSRAVS